MSSSFKDQAENISPEIYLRFKQALELGKWPDGRTLSAAQKEICMEAVLLYEAKQGLTEDQRVGYIDRSRKTSPCGPKHDHSSDDESGEEDDSRPVRILH